MAMHSVSPTLLGTNLLFHVNKPLDMKLKRMPMKDTGCILLNVIRIGFSLGFSPRTVAMQIAPPYLTFPGP